MPPWAPSLGQVDGRVVTRPISNTYSTSTVTYEYLTRLGYWSYHRTKHVLGC
ncbi:hypothetical protein HU200_042733 [Digitaria exilis]|uniref:Uncharacterized protein n=1 Tax=Digitaria exilis TaxID=1010633 RepID=A0A835EGZ6_9POAL|nr:hypothetical protein HU200_042733 [Digitaria exilis]